MLSLCILCPDGYSVTIAAPGTSCRHLIKDETGKMAIHPIEVMFEAVIKV